jgi:hypothetical protein
VAVANPAPARGYISMYDGPDPERVFAGGESIPITPHA